VVQCFLLTYKVESRLAGWQPCLSISDALFSSVVLKVLEQRLQQLVVTSGRRGCARENIRSSPNSPDEFDCCGLGCEAVYLTEQHRVAVRILYVQQGIAQGGHVLDAE
jgi:hypothetical protein